METTIAVRGTARPAARPDGRHLLTAAACVAVVAPVVVTAAAAWRSGWQPNADDALIELGVRDVPGQLPLVGVYSRFGFHHPGPLLFYVLALPYRLAGTAGLLAGAAAINALAATGCVLLAFRHGGRRFGVLATLALVVLEGASGGALADVWNPWISVLPFAFVVMATWALWGGDDWLLPVLAATASFVVQTHLAYTLVAGALLVVAGSITTTRVLRRERRARLLVVTAAVLVVCWAAPVAQQLGGSPGNLAAIATAFRTPAEPPAGPGAALDVTARALSVRAGWLLGDDELEPFTGRVSGVGWPAVVPFAVLAAASVALACRRRRTAQLRLQAVVGLGALTGALAVSRVTGAVYPYLVRWWWVLAALAWAAVLWPLADAAADAVAARWRPRPAALAGAAAALMLAAGAAASVRAARAGMADADLRPGADAVGAALVARVAGDGPVLLSTEERTWAQAHAGLAARLERDGIEVVVPDDLALQFGDHRTVGGRARRGLPAPAHHVVVARGPEVAAHLARGERPIGMWEPLAPAERREADALLLRAAVEYGDRMAGREPADPLDAAQRERLAALAAAGEPVAAFEAP